VDYDCDSITENTRAAYPIEYISNAAFPSLAGHPKTAIFLTADAFGVLPPIAKLSKEGAMYHFLSGYTSKVAGTERGIKEPEVTFSSCFGAPFLPLSPLTYAKLLGEKLARYDTNVFLINTGWSGGLYGIGNRIKLSYTRAMVAAALEGKLDDVMYELDSVFNIQVPKCCPGVDDGLLNPRDTWSDKQAYDRTAQQLAALFARNINRFAADIPPEVIAAGPNI
jgi:phosphoenolpyruvate carboxykinase (ATP)